jgi:hypothetical protein
LYFHYRHLKKALLIFFYTTFMTFIIQPRHSKREPHLGTNVDLVQSRVLLFRSVEDVNRPARRVDNSWDIESLVFAADSIDLGNLFGGELDVGEVLDNTRCGNGLGDDAVAANLGPGKAV